MSSPALPTVVLRTRPRGRHPFVFRKMLAPSAEARSGDLVRVVDRDGAFVGIALFHEHSQIGLRFVHRGPEQAFGTDFLERRLKDAVYLRRRALRLDERTDAWRVVHAEADGLSGLIVDRFADVLVIELFSLAWYRRLPELRDALLALFPGAAIAVRADEWIAEREGFSLTPEERASGPERVWIREDGLRFHVDLRHGHKTGFFVDQRENRARMASFVRDANVLDLCTNSGGFAIHAKVRGGAGRVTAVDLDEKALARAEENARANDAAIEFVHADVFDYLRAAQEERTRWDVVILDPAKLARSKDELPRAERKYFDMNRLAMAVLKNNGLLLTCSCTGLLPAETFDAICCAAAQQAERRILRLAQSGAAPDHPVDPDCPETSYLKAFLYAVRQRS
jgi:23S rRNA (cytosine1962-C5)-methyltransferase